MKEKGNRKKVSVDDTYIRPKEAAKKLKSARELRATAYLYGVTGIGKSSLVEDVLSRRKYEYYTALETGPEQIRIETEGKDQIIVIDDLHSISEQEQQEAYAELIESLAERRDIWLILISRSPIPKWLFPLHVKYMFMVIGGTDFFLTRQEQNIYMEKWGIHLTEETEKNTWELAEGYPLFLRLLAMESGDITQALKDTYNYVDIHVYNQWDMELTEFIMETSIVESFTVEMARTITGRSNVEELISRAEELGNFMIRTGQNGVWQYHWGVCQSMRQRLQIKYSAERIRHLYYNAGLYYEQHDEIPKALEMYEKYDDIESISRVLVANARKNPACGHYYHLRKYYLSLSEELIRKSPVLIAGMSMLQSMLMNEEESERWYHVLEEYAHEHTGSAKREAKSRLLYLDIALPHRGILHMTDILKNAGTLLLERKTLLPEFSVTSNLPSMMNGGKDFCEWSKRDKELASSIGKIVEFVLGKYGKGLVPLALAESYLEKGMDSYEIMILAEKGRMAAESGGKIEQCFVAVGILFWLSVIKGDAEYGEEILKSFERKAREEALRLIPNIQALQCRIYLYQGRMTEVMKWMQEAPDEVEEFCAMERLQYLTKVRVYLQRGMYEHACGLLQQLLYYAEKMKRTYIKMEANLLLAIAQYRMEREGWKENMQACISQAEEYHFVRLISREGRAALELLKAEEFAWKDPGYRDQVLAECEQMAGFYPNYLRERTDGDIVLSENGLKILRLQAEGYTTRKIAERLCITEHTVKYHNKETYRKLGVNSKVEAVNEARKRKLI